MIKVLFVCLGNICRSPLAEALFREKVSEKELSGLFEADSAGTAAYHIGELPDPRSRQNALQNGVQIDHRARQLSPSDFQEFDYILAMDQSNYRHIQNLAERCGVNHSNIFLMRHFQKDADSVEVPDPYFGGEQGFQKVFDILQEANRGLLDHLIKSHD